MHASIYTPDLLQDESRAAASAAVHHARRITKQPRAEPPRQKDAVCIAEEERKIERRRRVKQRKNRQEREREKRERKNPRAKTPAPYTVCNEVSFLLPSPTGNPIMIYVQRLSVLPHAAYPVERVVSLDAPSPDGCRLRHDSQPSSRHAERLKTDPRPNGPPMRSQREPCPPPPHLPPSPPVLPCPAIPSTSVAAEDAMRHV